MILSDHSMIVCGLYQESLISSASNSELMRQIIIEFGIIITPEILIY